ncbi:hypothetical protein Peur_054626 [Populus x canadensis]
MAIDGEDESKPNGQDQPRKTLRRKRATLTLKQQQQLLNIRDLSGNECSNVNAMVGLLMEESGMSFTKLVEEIYRKLVKMSGNLTVAVVKNAGLFVGQRVTYGVPNVDADILEDETHSCLWCWETRDFKLTPKSVHGALKIRRTCRKKIHDRIAVVSKMITALQRQETDQNYQSDLIKSSQKLGKVLTEADIRLLIDGLLQKKGPEIADKEAKQEETLLVKQLKKNKREKEKEKKRMDLELQKENRQNEKEQKRLQEEAEKDERHREREESEIKRQLKRQQEEVEKEQRRKEKEEAELKRRVAIQKQASMMERFLKRSRSDDIRKSHLSSGCHLGFSIRVNRKQHWSIRRKPKTGLFKELKLTAIRDPTHNDD